MPVDEHAGGFGLQPSDQMPPLCQHGVAGQPVSHEVGRRWRRRMEPDKLDPVQVLHRTATGDQPWTVDVDWTIRLTDLLPDLVDALKEARALPSDATPGDFVLRVEGSLRAPIVVLTEQPRRRAGNARPGSPSPGSPLGG